MMQSGEREELEFGSRSFLCVCHMCMVLEHNLTFLYELVQSCLHLLANRGNDLSLHLGIEVFQGGSIRRVNVAFPSEKFLRV